MEILNEFVSLAIFRNSLVDWLMALGLAIGLFLALLTTRRFIRGYYKRLEQTPETELIELPVQILSRTTIPLGSRRSCICDKGTNPQKRRHHSARTKPFGISAEKFYYAHYP